MNIFALSTDPVKAAEQMIDKHVIKMPTETCQMLHTNILYMAYRQTYDKEPQLKDLKAFHVACGTGGMATNLDQFGPALKLPWTRLEAPELTKELRDRMVNGCNAVAKDQAFEDMVSQRDREIVAVLNALRQARLM